MMKLLKIFFAIVACSSSFTYGARILIASPHGVKSHQNTYVPIAKELVRRGHHITILTNYANKELNQLENVHEICIEELAVDVSKMFPNVFESMTDPSVKVKMIFNLLKALLSLPTLIIEATYKDARVQQLMSSENFDLVMMTENCGPACYPLGWHFKAPTIVMSPNVLIPGRALSLGDDEHYSYVPFIFTSFTNKMSLYERTVNYLSSKFFLILAREFLFYQADSILKRMIGQECPPAKELEKNFSLVFTNTHPSFTYPRTLPPQVIEVGGIHCRPAKPLPEDLEAFVSSSDAGFLVFGVGSALKMDDMPEHVYQSFVETFSRLPQRVIWQWKGQPRSDLPKNVLAIPWLPQQDLLGNTVHISLRFIITESQKP